MKNILFKRSLVCGIIFLLIGLSVTSSIGENNEKTIDQNNYPLNTGLWGYWSFDEGTGTTANDGSGNEFHGTINGATWTTGHSSFALDFNGADAYVGLDTHSQDLGFNKADDYEISAWVQTETTSPGVIYCISNSVSSLVYADIAMDSDGSFIFRVGTEECTLTLTSVTGYNDGEWHFVDGKWYGDTVNPTMELYVDTELEDTLTEWQCPFNADDFETAKIGRKSSDDVAFDYFDGIIDEVKVYRELTGNNPPLEPTITGEDEGNIGTEYEYTFNAEDPDNDEVRYNINWGDGSEWTGYYLQGTDVKVKHTYDDEGTYQIKAYAQDENGADGPVTEYEVTMPKSKGVNFEFNPIYWLFERFPNAFPILKYILIITGFMDGFIRHGTGKLVMQLTDAPGLNITEALVNISKVRVHYAGWDQNDTNGTWVNVSNVTQTFDLIQLQNATDVLGEINLTAGWYTQIRLTVEKALVTIDGIQYDLKIPSKNVKLITPFLVQDNETLTLTLDFDVQKSVHKTGSDKYIMKPTIKVIQE